MELGYPLPNVVCRCGTLLFSWDKVLEHWARHQEELKSMAEHQKLMSELVKGPR